MTIPSAAEGMRIGSALPGAGQMSREGHQVFQRGASPYRYRYLLRATIAYDARGRRVFHQPLLCSPFEGQGWLLTVVFGFLPSIHPVVPLVSDALKAHRLIGIGIY